MKTMWKGTGKELLERNCMESNYWKGTKYWKGNAGQEMLDRNCWKGTVGNGTGNELERNWKETGKESLAKLT